VILLQSIEDEREAKVVVLVARYVTSWVVILYEREHKGRLVVKLLGRITLTLINSLSLYQLPKLEIYKVNTYVLPCPTTRLWGLVVKLAKCVLVGGAGVSSICANVLSHSIGVLYISIQRVKKDVIDLFIGFITFRSKT